MNIEIKQFENEIEELLNSNFHLGFRRFLDHCLDSRLSRGQKEEIIQFCRRSDEKVENELADEVQLIKDILLFKSQIEENSVNESPRALSSVQALHIKKTYKSGNFSLKEISFQMEPTQLIGIVGENGNGKTTLLRMIASDLGIDSGTINYNFDHTSTLYEVKRSIAYIPQRIPRWYGKLKNNLHFAASSRGIYGFENEFLVTVMLSRLGLSKYKNFFWNQISSGYRTRFELARILLLQPRVLILDEPLANLDINAQQTFLQDIRYLAKSRLNPLAILFSSQQLHEVEKVADHIIFLREGESVYNSTSDSQEKINTHTEIELETSSNREIILACLQNIEGLSVANQGGLFIIRSHPSVPSTQLLTKLVEGQVEIRYFRDLTHSTKKFFNQN